VKQTELTRGLNTLHSDKTYRQTSTWELRPEGTAKRATRILRVRDYFIHNYTHRSRVFMRDVKARSFKRRCVNCGAILYVFVYRAFPYMVGCYHGNAKEFDKIPGIKYGRLYRLFWEQVGRWLEDDKFFDLLLLAGTDPVDLEDDGAETTDVV